LGCNDSLDSDIIDNTDVSKIIIPRLDPRRVCDVDGGGVAVTAGTGIAVGIAIIRDEQNWLSGEQAV
tara:strand:- start:943 stop:1143 length:201 start_codon:yes stop_codon:yes gene_type:complete